MDHDPNTPPGLGFAPAAAPGPAPAFFLDAPPDGAPVVVFLIEQEGCPACEEFHPVFVQTAELYANQGLPIVRVNAATEDAGWQQWMGMHGVKYTPTVIAVGYGRGVIAKIEGGGSPVEAQMLLARALMAQRMAALPQPPRPWWSAPRWWGGGG